MRERTALLGLGTVIAVVLAWLASTGAWSAPAQPVDPSVGATSVQVLTSTLEVPPGAAIRDTHFEWAGPADSPMLRMTGTAYARLENVAFDVQPGRHATAAIEMVNGPGGGPFGNSLSGLRIGVPGSPAGLDYGIRWTGVVNGDSNTLTNVTVYGAGRAGVSVNNAQATGNSFRGLYVFNSPIGLSTAAGGTITCDNCGFIGSTDVDVELVAGGGLIITGVYSEGSRSFARIAAGPGGGGLSVAGGYWQHGPKASGPTFTGVNMCCYRGWLRLTDFMVTPLGAAPAGTVAGIPADRRFFSNAAGIAA